MGNNYLPTEYQTFIHASRYARWLPDKNRRETWIETVTRLTNFFQIHLKKNLGVEIDSEVWRKIEDNIIGLNASYTRQFAYKVIHSKKIKFVRQKINAVLNNK